MNSLKYILLIFIIWRIFLFFPIFLGEKFISYPQNQWYTNILYLLPENTNLKNPLIFPWSNFDGVHYLGIAKNGYTSDGRFLPAYPYLIGFLSRILGISSLEGYFWTGLIISNIFFLLITYFFYKLILLDYPRKIAFWSIAFLFTFPTSFFFASIYSESMFLFLSLLIFYLVRKNYFWLILPLSFTLLVTRLVGLAVIPALLFEFYLSAKGNFFKIINISKSLLIISTSTSILFFAMFNYTKWRDALFFLHAHSLLGNSRETTSVVLFPQTVYRYLKILISLNPLQYEWFIALLELCSFLFILITGYLALKKRIRFSYLIYAFLAVIIPISSGTFSGLPRYLSIVFPIYITMALVKSDLIKVLILSFFTILQFILLMFFSRGYFVA